MAEQYKMIGGDGREYGPATLEEMRVWCEEGRLSRTTLVWRSDEGRWLPASEWHELRWDLPPVPEAPPLPVLELPELPPELTVPAGFWIRAAAYVVDILVLSSLVAILTLPWAEPLAKLQEQFLAQRNSPTPDLEVTTRYLLASLAINLPLRFLYFTLFHGLRGATPGKMFLGIRVVREDGSPVGLGRAALRHAADLLNTFTFFTGYLLIAFHPEKRGLHDLIAGTRVIRIR
ncbi:MAG: RDD family protein [Verrucomicrobiales bacterium]|nr:RDD family protein [Verrucomicrobiales bacterium]